MRSHHVKAERAILLLAAHVLADGDLAVPLVAAHDLRRVRAELLGADGPAILLAMGTWQQVVGRGKGGRLNRRTRCICGF